MNSGSIYITTFKNSLSKLLCTIKQYYGYYLSVSNNLKEIITKIEELLILIENLQLNNNNKTQSEPQFQLQCDQKLLELFYFCFTLNTNSTFYDLFFKVFIKYLKQIKRASYDKQILETYPSHFNQIYISLLNRKIDYIGISVDIKAMLNILKCIQMIIDLFAINNTNYIDLNINELLSYFLQTNYTIFNMTKSMNHIDKYSKTIDKLFTLLLTSNEHKHQLETVFNQLLNKIIEISKIKDEMKTSIDDQEQTFQVDTLLVCLKLCSKALKTNNNISLFSYDTKLKLTRCLIELSFWDNPIVVNYNCKLFVLIWNSAINIKGIGMRNEIEKMIEFIFLRRFNEYYNYLACVSIDDENKQLEQKIKLAVIEILIRHVNHLISDENFLYITYMTNDNNKFRINTINEIYSSLHKYFNLKDGMYLFLKKSITILLRITFEKIKNSLLTMPILNNNSMSINTLNSNDKTNNNSVLYIQEILSDKWLEIFKSVNEGKFKVMYKQICDEFNMAQLPKTQVFTDINEDIKHKHTTIAKSIAILIRFSHSVDINLLYEIMGINHIMSNLILEEYTKTFNFKDLDFIQSYELYVSTFKLTGEQSHISNFIYKFSQKFFNDNKNETKEDNFYFKSEEEVNLFAYSTMILNTDLHNPNVNNHMSCDEFIKNNLKSNLFEDIPKEYIRSIYNRIQSHALKAAQPRRDNYEKEDELYYALKSLHCYIMERDELKSKNLFNELSTLNKRDIIQYPLFNLYQDIYIDKSNERIKRLLFDSISFIYEDLFCTVLSLPQSFFELKDDNVLLILDAICSISQSLKNKEVIDKIIRTLYSFIINTKAVRLYNLFFKLSIKYINEFHSYLEMYYKAMIDIIAYKLKEDKNTLMIAYTKLIDEIIYKTHNSICEKKKRTKNDSTFFNMIFFTGASVGNDDEISYEAFKSLKYQQMDLDTVIHAPLSQEDALIELSDILAIIKSKDEEFIFFATHSASKIIEYQTKTEFYLSMIFLNEILKGISQNEFIKIWQNLHNIFISKMEFKKDSNNDKLFDVLYINFFLNQILSQYFTSIENNDYYQLLENYINIDNIEVLFIVLENNNDLIENGITNKKYINDQIFSILIFLIHRLIDLLTHDNNGTLNLSMKNNTHHYIAKVIKVISFFQNSIMAIKDIAMLLSDSLKLISKIIQLLYDLNIVHLLIIHNFSFEPISNLISALSTQLAPVLPQVNDDKWDLYLFIAQFSFKCALVENEDAQLKFMELLIYIFETPKIPLVRYNYIITILVNWYTPYIKLRIRYNHFWDDVFNIFYLCLTNNEDIKTSNSDIEQIWSLFIRKYLISFVDEGKRNKKNISDESMKTIEKIYNNVQGIVKLNGEKVAWWESSRNFIKLYFPNLVKD